MAPNYKSLDSQYQNTEYTLPSEECVLLTAEELRVIMNFTFEPIPNIDVLLNVEPIIISKIDNAGGLRRTNDNKSDEEFQFDHDPVPFLEQLLDEYDAQEADDLFEYDINPVLFLEELLEDDNEIDEVEEHKIPQKTYTVEHDDDFVFDHDPVPFLEELLAEYDAQETEKLKSLEVDEEIYNGESMYFYNKNVSDRSALEQRLQCGRKNLSSKNVCIPPPYVKSRTFINSRLHHK